MKFFKQANLLKKVGTLLDFKSGTLLRNISREPLDPKAHFEYAIYLEKTGRIFLAYAEFKTAEYLGFSGKGLKMHVEKCQRSLPDIVEMEHNQYFRFYSIHKELAEKNDGRRFTVLDVGGGQGKLASFMPECGYCLADINTNGISGINLPFSDGAFDYVVSCHVLEHIPKMKREHFLDQLLSVSKTGIILLNPFEIEGLQSIRMETLELVSEVTNAGWAAEHLECGLPRLEDVKAWAEKKGLRCDIKPNATLATSIGFVFLDYFASRSGKVKEWKKVNRIFNQNYGDLLDSDSYPTGYLIYIGKT